MALHTFNDDDRVIYHKTDRQYQAEERECIDGKTKQREEHERSHKRNRYSQQWDQRRTPALKEKKNNDDYQDKRDEKSPDDFLDALSYRKSRIEGNGELRVLGKALFHLRHQFLDAGRCVDCVRSGQLVGCNNRSRLAVETSGYAVILSTQFDPSDVAYAHSCAVGVFTNHNVAKFFRRNESPLRKNSVGILLALGSRLASSFACGIHGVL